MPYFERPCRRWTIPAKSNLPRIILYLTPGRSLARPPRINTWPCFCRLWPIPGICAVIRARGLKNLTLAIRLLAEFGFLGDITKTRRQTPLRWGFFRSATVRVRKGGLFLGYLESWWLVGICVLLLTFAFFFFVFKILFKNTLTLIYVNFT